ncbi:MAG: hypothetical protein J5798_05185 [Spirochaetaceae bacterium]|nr:hypothetical protein [Spirochaetaceae bacterium]
MCEINYQDEGIVKEFEGLKLVEIQEKCKNLNLGYQLFEYGDYSFVAISTNDSISFFITGEGTKYVPLKISPVRN